MSRIAIDTFESRSFPVRCECVCGALTAGRAQSTTRPRTCQRVMQRALQTHNVYQHENGAPEGSARKTHFFLWHERAAAAGPAGNTLRAMKNRRPASTLAFLRTPFTARHSVTTRQSSDSIKKNKKRTHSAAVVRGWKVCASGGRAVITRH